MRRRTSAGARGGTGAPAYLAAIRPAALPSPQASDEFALERTAIEAEAGGSAYTAGLRDEVLAVRAVRGVPRVDGLLVGVQLADALPPLVYTVGALGLTAGSGAPHLIAGYGFSGKTLAMQSMLLSLAAGRPVWGVLDARESRVLHVDLEQGRRLTQRRYQRLARAVGIELRDLGDRLAVLCLAPLALTPDHQPAWRELMRGRDVILIDSLRAATGGMDENSSEIRAPLDMLGRLSEETQCRAYVIHHGRKPKEPGPSGGKYAIRGSAAIFDACDCVFTFAGEKGEPISVDCEKAREHGEIVRTLALVISDVEADGDPKAGVRVHVHGAEVLQEHRDAKSDQQRVAQGVRDARRLRAAIVAAPGINSGELRARTGFSAGRMAAAKLALGAELEVRDEKVGRATRLGHFLRRDDGKEPGA